MIKARVRIMIGCLGNSPSDDIQIFKTLKCFEVLRRTLKRERAITFFKMDDKARTFFTNHVDMCYTETFLEALDISLVAMEASC